MDIYEMKETIRVAKRTVGNADYVIENMAFIIAGRLRISGVSGLTLEKLKKELRDYNIHTGRWRDK